MKDGDNTFLAEVERAFSRELGSGALRVAGHYRSLEVFGDDAVILEGLGLRLKLKRERSEPYALVASDRKPEEWERLQAAISAVTGEPIAGSVEPVGWELSPNEAAALFRNHEEALAEGYASWSSWRSRRKRLVRVRMAQQEGLDAWLRSPKGEVERIADESADNALANPSERLRAALKSLDLDE